MPVEHRRLGDLRPHPRQADTFGDLPVAELDALVEDIRQHGLRHAIEILKDGTVVAGHQRVRAAQMLGWTEIACIVRHDLAADPVASERRLISDNMLRRQLSQIDRVRLATRCWELDGAGDGIRSADARRAALVKYLASTLGMTDRNARRYLSIVDLPLSIQQAFGRGELRITLAERLAKLPKTAVSEISKAIEAGTAPAKAVAPYCASARTSSVEKLEAWLQAGSLIAASHGKPSDLAKRMRNPAAALEAIRVISPLLDGLQASLEQSTAKCIADLSQRQPRRARQVRRLS